MVESPDSSRRPVDWAEMAVILDSMERIREQVEKSNLRLLYLCGKVHDMENRIASAERTARLLRAG